jgi:hypothetical protein
VSELPGNLNGRGLTRHYHDLEPDERFRLVLSADARDDDRERERLVTTCPVLGYTMSDARYLDRIDASNDMAVAVALQLGPQLAQAKMLEAGGELVARTIRATAELAVALATGEDSRPGPAEATSEAEPEPDAGEDSPPDAPMVRATAEVSAKLRSEAAAVYEAFAKVCRDEMGLEPAIVLRAHLGPLHVAMLGLEALDGVKPDKAAMRQWHEMFERTWRRRVGG